jgi:acetolactate synthase-1/2/3 large subunit
MTRFVEWLAADLYRRGTRFAFGVPGGGVSLDLLDAVQAAGMQSVITAREDAAAIMAGVAGRLAHAPGLAFSTKGPGLASATNGLASALLDRLPMLAVTESFDAAELQFLSHQVFDQRGLADSLFAAVDHGKAKVLNPEPQQVSQALDAMLNAPIGPGVLLADPAWMQAQIDLPVIAANTPVVLDVAALDRAYNLLKSARRPVIVVGLEATHADIANRVRRLAYKLGAPVLTTYMAKGVIADTAPHFAGIFTGGAIEQPTVNAADLIITIGLDPVELIRKPWPYETPVLDLAAFAHNPHYFTPASRVTGDIAAILSVLPDVSGSDWTSVEIAERRQAFLDGMAMPDSSSLSAATVVQMAVSAFEGKPRLTVDAGAHMFSACAFWQASKPLDVLISNGLASMGFALPAAVAAALHDPARGAVAMTGDGGLLMCLGELKTAAEVGANLTVIVFNDARLSLIDIKREQRQMPDLGLSWKTPDFATVAEGFGFKIWRAENAGEMRAAADAAAASSGPCLIDARVDPSGYLPQLRALRG